MENHQANAVPQILTVAETAAEPKVLPSVEPVEVSVDMEESHRDADESRGDDGEMVVTVASWANRETETAVKRKRGRPRKQPLTEAEQELIAAQRGYSAPPQKRGRGRPKGSGKWQTLAASIGGSIRNGAGSNFTPYVLPIRTGENIVQRLLSFSQCTSDSLCIISASGTISYVEIVTPCVPRTIVRYQGRFDIVSLKGSYLYSEIESRRQKSSLLTVQFVDPEGIFYGGAVTSLLIAAGPIQLVLATFKENWREQPKARHRVEAPKPKQIVAASGHVKPANDTLTDAEVQGAADICLVPAPSMADGINAPDIRPISLQPSDWSSSQPSMDFVVPNDEHEIADS